MLGSTDTSIINVSAVHNKNNGIILYYATDTSMISVSAANNVQEGIRLHFSTDTSMMNISAVYNKGDGIWLENCTDTSMMNVSAAHNVHDGIWLIGSTDTSMMNVSAAYNEVDGILYWHNSTNTSMMNISAAHNGHWGIRFCGSTDTSMMNVYAVHNGFDGIWLDHSTNTSLMNVSAVHNGHWGIRFCGSTDTSMMNIYAVRNVFDGICLDHSTNTSLMNVSAVHNNNSGIQFSNCINQSMMTVSAAHNVYGIMLFHSTDTSMLNVSAAHNVQYGIFLRNSNDTSMMNVFAAHNQNSAITMIECINTGLNYSYTYQNRDGIIFFISNCTTTHIFHHNTGSTIYIVKSTDTHIVNSVLSENSNIELRNTAKTHNTNTTSLITAYGATNIILKDTLFSDMDASSVVSSTLEPTSLLAVISLYSSTLNITDCKFTRNKISSFKTIGSKVNMSGKVLFHNNTASLGTVLISAKNSLLIVTDYSTINFEYNHATYYGGVFYITTEESYETSMTPQDIFQNYNRDDVGGSLINSRTECFVLVEGSRSHARLTFINNTAGRGGDVLYGGLVALGYDGDWNCLLSFKNISDMSQQSGLSLISSAPSRVCLCNETGQPDCLTVADPIKRVIYPGQTITIPAVVVGQDFGTVTGSVFAQFHTKDSIYMGQKQDNIAVEHSQCSNLEYTIFSQREESAAVLVLTHDNKKISQLMNEDDNQEISSAWEILNKKPNYKTLAQDIICDFIKNSNYIMFVWQFTKESHLYGNRTIENFYKFTTAFIFLSKYEGNCDRVFRQITKFAFPKEIYNYPVYINISFCPCPSGFALSKDQPFKCNCSQLMK